MKVKTLIKFRDLEEGRIREIGDVFKVTERRCEELTSHPFGILVEKIKEMTDNEQSNRYIKPTDK